MSDSSNARRTQPLVVTTPMDALSTNLRGQAEEAIPLAELAIAGQRYGRFNVLRAHAEGGLGEVLIARDEELDREVAFKRIKARHAANADARRRFLSEAAITAKLEHPGIVPIYGLVQDAQGQPSYAMRFIEGQSLKQAISDFHGVPQAFDSVPFRQLLQRFVTVCQTVAFAHSRGVLHRDLKPANIMLGRFGETLVVDWGLAKELTASGQPSGVREEEACRETIASAEIDPSAPTPAPLDSHTRHGQALGTPAYMAPEQAAGQWDAVGPRSDVYSLGAVLYEMLTGQLSVHGQDVIEVLSRVKEGRILRPRHWRPHVPKALEAICLQAMALHPEDRYESAETLARDVEQWLADEPVAAYREPWPLRAGRWLRRHPALATGLGVLFASALAVLALVAVLLDQARTKIEAERAHTAEERDQAQKNFARAEATAAQLEREKAKVEVEQRRTAAERDLARKNLALAKDAVDKTVTRVALHPRLKEADFIAVRKELLAEAVPMYEEFVRQRSDDPKLEAGRGSSLRRLADVYIDLEQRDKALEKFRQMAAVFEPLAERFPEEHRYREELAGSHIGAGLLLRQLDRPAEAVEELAKAEAQLERLIQDEPKEPAFRRQLGICRNNLGNAYLGERDYSKAEEVYRRALEIQTTLAQDFPSEPQYARDLARTHSNFGVVLERTGRRTDAAVSYRRSMDLYSRLASTFPKDPDFRWELTGSQHNLAMLLDALGERVEAEQIEREAASILERLAADFPSMTRYRRELANSCITLGRLVALGGKPAEGAKWYGQGVTLLEAILGTNPPLARDRSLLISAHWGHALSFENSDRSKEALPAWDRAIALSPRNLELKEGRALSLAHAGDHVKAFAEVNELAAAPDVPATMIFNLAAISAAASAAAAKDDVKVADEYAARAVELLRQAVVKGYSDIDEIKKNVELKPVREREDYKKLIKELMQ